MPVTIRRAQRQDVDQMAVLWRELMDFHVALDPHLGLGRDAEWHWRGSCLEWMQDDDWRVLVAEEDNHLIGFITGSLRDTAPILLEPRRGMVQDAVVTARSRRRGVGEALYRELAQWFRGRGVSVVELNAAAANPVSQAFWRKMGFGDYLLRLRTEL